MDRTLDSWFGDYRQSGDPEALGRVFDALAPRLAGRALLVLGDPAAAEDALQSTFLAALRSSAGFVPGRRVMPWLVTILTRQASNLRRARGRRRLRIRDLDERHHFTLVCRDFAQLGHFVHVSNAAFRAIKAATPGPYTFILPGTPEVPRRLLHPKKRTVGVRIPDHRLVQTLLEALGEPLLSTTLILPGEEEARTDGWAIKEDLDHQVDLVLECGEVTAQPTTVIDWSEGVPEVVRAGAGDPARFEG